MSRDCERISSSPSLEKASSRSCLSTAWESTTSRSSMTTSVKQTFGRIVHFEKTHGERSDKKGCCTFWQTYLSSFVLASACLQNPFKKASGLGHYPLLKRLLRRQSEKAHSFNSHSLSFLLKSTVEVILDLV